MEIVTNLVSTVVRDAAHLASILDRATAQAFFECDYSSLDRDVSRMVRDRAWRRAKRAKHGR